MRDGMSEKEMAAFALFEQLQKRENQNIESIKKSDGGHVHHKDHHKEKESHGPSSPTAPHTVSPDNEKQRAAMALFEQLQKRENENKESLKRDLKRV
jgi:hypothetical protein